MSLKPIAFFIRTLLYMAHANAKCREILSI